MKSYTIEVMVTDDIAEQLNQACETLNKKGYFFSSEKMMDLAIFHEISVHEAVNNFCKYAENVSERVMPEVKCYRVILSEARNEYSKKYQGSAFGTFLSYEEAFDYVGMCMCNDIDEFGQPNVYQILCLDSGQVVETVELDNEKIEPPCQRPTYSEYGCLGCTECKTESAPEIDAKDFEGFEEVIQGLEMPF